MANPTMFYKYPGPHEIHGGTFDYAIFDLDVDGELDKALSEGWHETTDKAKLAVYEAEDNAPATREELETKASELGIKFTAKTTDAQLNSLINKKLGE